MLVVFSVSGEKYANTDNPLDNDNVYRSSSSFRRGTCNGRLLKRDWNGTARSRRLSALTFEGCPLPSAYSLLPLVVAAAAEPSSETPFPACPFILGTVRSCVRARAGVQDRGRFRHLVRAPKIDLNPQKRVLMSALSGKSESRATPSPAGIINCEFRRRKRGVVWRLENLAREIHRKEKKWLATHTVIVKEKIVDFTEYIERF